MPRFFANIKLDFIFYKFSAEIMKGRKKIPDELKSLRGTDQPCRMTGNAVPAGTAVATLPRSGLKGTAKKVFEVVATELIHKCLLDVVGADLVVAYAREMGLYHDMMRETEKEGYTIEVVTKHGTATVVNPKRKVAESALANAKALAAEFGLTPASRSRVAALLSDNTPKDDFAEFEEIK
nr:MAG TPA: terminase small subunit [Caudoviricetes sp.]